jgi:predicted regulator of Ras-like GTPase activity (Roadblock/LC7/MglB family)
VDDARTLLAAVTSVPGVSGAVVMDRGGFVIEWAGGTGMDAEDVAAVASCLRESAESIGRELRQGGLKNLICEFDEGVVLVMELDFTTRLAVILRDPAELDAVRRCTMRVMPVPLRP